MGLGPREAKINKRSPKNGIKTVFNYVIENMTAYNKKWFTLSRLWIIGLISLIFFNILAIYNVSAQTCGKPFIPILLSRSLTTDPWRGITLGYSLLAIAASYSFNSSIITTAFFGFFSAFVISMFDTPASHDVLIGTSSLLVMYECLPASLEINLRLIHYIFVIVFGNIFFIWLIYSKLYYDDEKCSWMFVTEYITFWLMNALILWIIPEDMYAQDAICEEAKRTDKRQIQNNLAFDSETNNEKQRLLDF